MSTQRNILIAFLLNLTFSVFELFGGIFTGSVAILSDSVHDLGDAVSIGASWLLERKSRKKADNKFTYGYIRFSVLGGIITTTILFAGSVLVIISAVKRVIHPVPVDYGKMIVFAVVGVVLNLTAALVTRRGDSINQKSVNLHMLEDVLGWLVVLAGAVIMRFTDISLIDPLMSIGVSLFILISAAKNLKEVLDLFLEKTPDNINIEELKRHLLGIDGVEEIHHIHIRSMDGINNYATMHIVTKTADVKRLKEQVREELAEHNICHAVLETEEEPCDDIECAPHLHTESGHHHHHHHEA